MEYRNYQYARNKLLKREEIAFLDVREEALHAEGHPLFASNFPYSRIELNAYTRLPRMTVPILTIDDGTGLAEISAQKLESMGYTNVSVFRDGIAGWKAAGGELFIDVNVPSKAFGELMEARCNTPSLPAPEVEALLDSDEDIVVLDVRPFNEYHRMSIPGGINVPGVELLHRVADLVPNPESKIIVNCAGRTRGLLGAQSLINAGISNPVAALRNGTIGWILAGQNLETSQSRTFSAASTASLDAAAIRSRRVADSVGVGRATRPDIEKWRIEMERTTYYFDVRSRIEYEAGHEPRFFGIEGGQLIQETEVYAPVRGARIVVMDDDGVRANMTASWLAQMDWDVYVWEMQDFDGELVTGCWELKLPDPPSFATLQVNELVALFNSVTTSSVLNFSRFASHLAGHIPNSLFVLRSQLREAVKSIADSRVYVVTDDDGILSPYVAPELSRLVDGDVMVLQGGNSAWKEYGLELESGPANAVSPPIDRYQRPYVGTEISADKMQAYLDWEFGLIAQLERDGTHHFRPVSCSGAVAFMPESQ